ncbi:hypothetical protein CRENPOLYSF2_60007 [Crenothrix polyspora]|uniref:Uncharacterized protein n=1 Tax=Crenothrix polyspora TaxID=360316 RepID=A0A1R4HH20_9GAMM|nr:hypothetical protein CRENPOLYSF2_60007 [Crenothrix polyspora]
MLKSPRKTQKTQKIFENNFFATKHPHFSVFFVPLKSAYFWFPWIDKNVLPYILDI